MKINARQTAETYSLYAAHFKASDRNKTETKNSTKKTINPQLLERSSHAVGERFSTLRLSHCLLLW